jgi:NAD(P)-dependent dehydrogenase (short-subunit alcohol dehydrogenase family)
MRLKDKCVLVNGAAGGLGRAIVERFAREGASVMCSDLKAQALGELTERLVHDGTRIASVVADVGVAGDCQRQVDETVSRFGRIDVLVNSAGIALHRLALDTTSEDWERVLRINLTGSLLCAQAAARYMVQQGSGRIVQLGSISGQRGNMGGLAYGASKAAVMHMCKVMAVELSSKGVMINAIAPGPIETGISVHGPTRKRGYLERIPAGTYGSASSVANAALYLASDECEWVTGTIVNVDGGYGGAGLAYDAGEITGP